MAECAAISVTPAQAFEAVREVMAGPIVWGRSDCCTAAADVFLRLWGMDPMPTLRGRFSTPGGALRAVELDLRTAFRAEVERAGLRRMPEISGAIGLLAHGCVFDAIAGICIRPGEWAVRTADGFGSIWQPDRAEAWA